MNLGTPTWLNPSQPGQMSNKFGANASTDLISLSAQYRSPDGDVPSGARLLAQRNAVAGATTPSPNYIWDTDWIGAGAASALPVSSGTVLGANSSVYYAGRVYQLVPSTSTPSTGAIAGVCSAPINGANVGAWRWENPVLALGYDPYNNPFYISDSISPGAMVRVYNWLYVLALNGVYYAQLQTDGTIGQWQQGLGSVVNGSANPIVSSAGATMAAWQNTPANGTWSGGILIQFGDSAGSIQFHQTSLTAGYPLMTPLIFGGAGLPAQRSYGSLHIDPYNGVFYIGGENSSGVPQTTVYYNSTMNFVSGSAGSWTSTATALPAARSRFGFAAYYNPNSQTTVQVWVCGGEAASGGTAQSTAYSLDTASIAANTGTWTNWGSGMSTATKACSAIVGLSLGGVPQATLIPTQTPPPVFPTVQPYRYDSAASGTYKGYPVVFCMGGSSTSSVQSCSAEVASGEAWIAGPTSTVLSSSSFGTSGAGAVTQNADGSVTLVFPFADANNGGWGTAKNISGLSNGDQVQVGVQFASSTTGDVTPISWTLFTIGQAPTATLSVPTTGGQPAATMSYTAGAGGSYAASWRLKITRTSDSVLMFDSGLMSGTPTSAQVTCAPALVSGTAYTAALVATSLDSPITGASNSVTVSHSVTPSYTAAGSLTGLSATASNSPGYTTLTWSATSGANYYRVYYRLTGSSTWTLLLDGVTTTTVALRDRIPLGRSVDFAVSAVKTGGLEGTLSSTVSATVNAVTGGYSSMLHVAGDTSGTALYVPLLVQDSPTIKINYDSVTIPLQGRGQPVVRLGVQNWRNLSFDNLVTDQSTVLDELQNVLAAAQQSGALLYYRDSLGQCFPVGLDKQSAVSYLGSILRKVSPSFVQVGDTYGAYVSVGSALGIPTLVAGSLPPLDPSLLV